MKRILVPCDFSEPAVQAYRFAMTIAERTNAEVSVLRVIDLPPAYDLGIGTPPYYFDANLVMDMEVVAAESFEKMQRQYPNQKSVTLNIKHGAVTPTIRQAIKEFQIDLVVMGTHGASGWQEFWVGSNTEKIVRTSSVPVLAIRKSIELKKITDIVFPTTLHLDQTYLVNHVKELQSFFSAKLHLLLVNTPHNMKRTKDEMEMMADYATHFKLENYTTNIRNDFYEQDAIISFTHEIKAGLIAMGTSGRRGLSHLFAGSIAEDVVNHADCPIWTFASQKE
jgi:nucleotide-binding universal stress UspA family protein